ncbi:SIS domain-containing protein [Carnobacterium viridans]|uniref:Galactosamine 6-phosphate isomerase AgaS n=1 Tax=Carnobacterium viridans TaxID=174587 RepID=A0A1H0ZG77_9LACT|nr:SIS domain-containing protein [Carnobacterium viridans]UDE94645.1 SIS domain-containing protein [Carnobacterium viridans]SDQ26515.1 galactosamine 6-phosphate isomerase AgaS [Carnobacterium viridans]
MQLFTKSQNELKDLGATITTQEIMQQPEIWEEAWKNYQKQEEKINSFLEQIKKEANGKIRIVFTGAGTSAYVGDTIVPYLNKAGDTDSYIFESIPTTDIVVSPKDHLHEEDWTVLVSFARSGNSPESIAAVVIADQGVKNIRHIMITCAADGALAKAASQDEKNLLLLMPERSNDQGFAMTGSFTCMTLTALLVFDQSSLAEKESYVTTAVKMGKEVVENEEQLDNLLADGFDRIIYLGSGSLAGLTREAQLKVLELTAGKIATMFDSSMGFRHGPKSFVNEQTLVFVFVNNDHYTRKYDLDILEEIQHDHIAKQTIAIAQSVEGQEFSGTTFGFDKQYSLLPEGYLALPFIMAAQTVSLLSSVKVKNTPDTPSKSGTVNRVVKGVTIHDYKE